MTQGITQGIKIDRLDLTDLLEISDLLLRNRAVSLRVAGWSMYPTLRKGDRLTVEPVSPTQLQVGDLLLLQVRFPQEARLVCHRLVAVDETHGDLQLVTKGDAVTGCGETIQPSQVLGKVVAVKRRWPWAGSLSKRTDGWLAQLRDEVASGLLALQGLRSYRRIMRALLSRCFAYQVGIPEGRQWFRYHPISHRGGNLIGFTDRRDFHLLAKLGEICVGSVRITASGEGYRIDDLYVRIRYRGLGVASRFISFASTLAAQSEAGWLLAEIEKPNRTAISLFESAGFRLHPSTQSASRLIFVQDYAPAGQRVVP